MTKPPFKTGLPADRREVERPTANQVIRQLGTIVIVAVVWSALLVGFVQITGKTDDQLISEETAPASSTTAAIETGSANVEATSTQVVEPTPTQGAAPAATSSNEKVVPTPAPSVTPPPTEEPAGSELSFAQDVLPILEGRCVQCHNSVRSEGGLLLNTHEAVMAGSSEGPVVVPGDAADSLLVELIVSGRMPRRGPTLIPSEIETITRWVDGGALDN